MKGNDNEENDDDNDEEDDKKGDLLNTRPNMGRSLYIE